MHPLRPALRLGQESPSHGQEPILRRRRGKSQSHTGQSVLLSINIPCRRLSRQLSHSSISRWRPSIDYQLTIYISLLLPLPHHDHRPSPTSDLLHQPHPQNMAKTGTGLSTLFLNSSSLPANSQKSLFIPTSCAILNSNRLQVGLSYAFD